MLTAFFERKGEQLTVLLLQIFQFFLLPGDLAGQGCLIKCALEEAAKFLLGPQVGGHEGQDGTEIENFEHLA